MAKITNNKVSFGGGIFSGIIIGIILSVLYIKFNFKLPDFLNPVEKAKTSFISMTSKFVTDEDDIDELQREIEVMISRNSDYYRQTDNALDKFITEEIVWQEKMIRKIKLLQQRVKILSNNSRMQEFPHLKNPLKRILSQIPDNTKEENTLIYNFLKTRFPDCSDQAIIESLKEISWPDLFQVPYPSYKIVFVLRMRSLAKIEIFNNSSQKIKTLLDTELPLGHYRLYWDYTNNEGERMPLNRNYRYKLFIDGNQKRFVIIEPPKVLNQNRMHQ